MNMDSNIKDNGEPVTWPTIETQLAYWSSRRRSDFRSAAIRSAFYGGPNAASNALGYAKHYSRSHDAVIHVYDDAGNVIEAHEHKGRFERAVALREPKSRYTVKRDG